MSTSKIENKTITKKRLVGRVISAKMQHTVVVEISRIYHHPLYKKSLRRSRKILVHNNLGELSFGDMVEIVESRPLSKNKHYIVKSKLKTT